MIRSASFCSSRFESTSYILHLRMERTNG
jgi:hypothetical protein